MLDSWWVAGTLGLTAYLAAALAWPARRLEAGGRAGVLGLIALVPFVLPAFCPPQPILAKVHVIRMPVGFVR